MSAPRPVPNDCLGAGGIPARLPTDPGLFGPITKTARPDHRRPTARLRTPPLFDLREHDLPGQRTIEDY